MHEGEKGSNADEKTFDSQNLHEKDAQKKQCRAYKKHPKWDVTFLGAAPLLAIPESAKFHFLSQKFTSFITEFLGNLME